VQGFASDTTLVSVVDIVKQLPSVKVVGTVHDSVLMEIPTAEVDGLLPRIKSIMENPPTFKEMGIEVTLPIKVDISVGNWGSGKKWEPTEPAREPLNTSKSIS
jgi:DNA polymerase I-like protein with 3'-5' exonuclease and polymerase domains